MQGTSIIYLDYNATTPCDPRVVEKMLPYFTELYANPANGYNPFGRTAARATDQAREQVAALIGARSGEIFFTSGATESNNLAILGLARRQSAGQRRRIVTTAVEHKAVLLPCKQLQSSGFELVVLPVDRNGRVLVEAAREAIKDDTLLVSVQAANNEVGTLQPIEELAAMAHEHGALFHCDAAQAVGKIPVDIDALGVDLLSISAHKLYGPKGIGALYSRAGAATRLLEPLYYGGGQEHGLRSGTSNVPGIVGFGEACAIAGAELPAEMERIAGLRDLLEQELARAIPTVLFHAQQAPRLPNTCSVALPGIDGDALLLNVPNVMMGLGSACNSGAIEPSHVLEAMGIARDVAYSTVRVSLGRFTREQDVAAASDAFYGLLNNLQLVK